MQTKLCQMAPRAVCKRFYMKFTVSKR